MTKLEYTFTNDTLFKMIFVKYPDLLKRLVSELLGIRRESIREFVITNPEMPPEALGEKFCRPDINMTVDGQRVDLAKIEALEVTVMKEAIGAYRQVSSTGEFKEIERLRSLARHNEASALHHARSMGIVEGEARGKAEGIAEGQIKSVITVLEIRFGEVSATLRKALLDIRDDGRIESLLKQAATCQNLMDFRKMM